VARSAAGGRAPPPATRARAAAAVLVARLRELALQVVGDRNRFGRLRLGPALPGEDGVNEGLAAQPAKAVDAQLRGDLVQVCERALGQRGTVEY
jgi:hypothetical protein